MMVHLAIAAPLVAMAATLARAGRRDPARRARQEAAWRELIAASGLAP